MHLGSEHTIIAGLSVDRDMHRGVDRDMHRGVDRGVD